MDIDSIDHVLPKGYKTPHVLLTKWEGVFIDRI